MNSSWHRFIVIWVLLVFALFGLWSGSAVWAGPAQAPERQTVPTRVRTEVPSPVPPTQPPAPTVVPPTQAPVPTYPPLPTPVPPISLPTEPKPTSVPPTATLTPTVASPAPVQVTATARDNLRIRASPSTSAAILGQLPKGQSAWVVGRTVASDWWQIVLPADATKRGWVFAELAAVGGPVDQVPVVLPGVLPNTFVAPANTAVPPTNTRVPPTNAPIQPTDTPVPPASVLALPTNVPVQPTGNPAVVSKTAVPQPSSSATNPGDLGMIIPLSIGGGLILLVVGGVAGYVFARRSRQGAIEGIPPQEER
jgi:uncharacterized protein YraI